MYQPANKDDRNFDQRDIIVTYAGPTTPNKGYAIPTTNSETNLWGDDINDLVTSVVDLNIGGTLVLTLTNANVSLTSTQSQYGIIRLNGTLSGAVQITTSNKGFTIIDNATTGSYAVTFTNGVGSAVAVPQGFVTLVITDATYGARVL
jgi:hypothetical protein